MPRIKRWFPVSHDINADPELWQMTDRFGDRSLRIWLELLSIADRNDGEIKGERNSLQVVLSSRLRTTFVKVSSVLDYALERGWLILDGGLKVANYAKYHISRDAKEIPQGISTVSPPSLPSLPSEPDTLKDTYIYAAATRNGVATAHVEWPDSLKEISVLLQELNLTDPQYCDVQYWQTIDRWVGRDDIPIYYLQELRAYVAHQRSKPLNGKGRHKNFKQGFRNWLATALRFKERENERQAARFIRR